MPDKASQRGAVDAGVILMVVAFAVIGGFLYWLNAQATLERSMEIAEDTASSTTAVDELANATTISPMDIQTDAVELEGQLVRLAGMAVSSRLGQQGFWLDLPQGPFLVSLSDSLIADSVAVEVGSTVTVTGMMMPMNDSIAASWFEAGRISEGDQLAAGFAAQFIDAQRVETTGSAPGGGNGGL